MKRSIYILSLFIALLTVACTQKTEHNILAYQNSKLNIEQRLDDLMSRMTLEEKVAQMCQYVGLEHMQQAEKELSKEEMEHSDAQGFYHDLHSSDVVEMVKNGLVGSFLHVVKVEEANYLQKLALESRLKIPLLIGIDAIHGTGLVEGATIYPTPIGLASTWDTALVKKMSEETALEMRATGAAWTFTPNIDVARDARWGRVGETFGEDPFLVSLMGVAMIEGLQDHPEKDRFRTIACAKHLIAGSQSVNGLNGAPTDLSERTIREVFLPPYQAAVDAGVFSLMTAHNELNGIPCHADKWMMSDVLRDEMGFEGFIVSDWMDIERIATRHFTAKNQKEACYQTVDAGMDMHMHGPDFLEPIMELIKEGRLKEERINQSARRILEAKFRLGLFENAIVDEAISAEVMFNEEHQQTALKTAQKSIVLLKNQGGLLPLNKSEYKNIFITGPNANNETILGDWALRQPQENTVTIVEGVKQLATSSHVDFLDVGNNIRTIDENQVQEAGKRAAKADLAIVVVGENSFRWEWKDKTCGENAARSELGLAGLQQQLVEAVFKSKTPTIVVLVNGRPLATEWIAENVPTLIEAWESGSKGGLALAQILFGEVNPSGKLPITIPRSAGHQLSIYNHKPTHYFHKYVTTQSTPLFEFGYGLSYTTYTYQNLKVSKPSIKKGEKLTIKVEVNNTGKYAGEETVQLYINDNVASVTRPVKELKAFKKIYLEPGETEQVSFIIEAHMLQFLGKDLQPIIEPGLFSAMVGGSSRDKDLLTIPFEVVE